MDTESVFVCLVGFLTSTTRLYRGWAPRQSVWQFYVLPHVRQSWETMTSVSASHIILTPTQPEGSGRPQYKSNAGPHQGSRALPTELPRPLSLSPLHSKNAVSLNKVHTTVKPNGCGVLWTRVCLSRPARSAVSILSSLASPQYRRGESA